MAKLPAIHDTKPTAKTQGSAMSHKPDLNDYPPFAEASARYAELQALANAKRAESDQLYRQSSHIRRHLPPVPNPVDVAAEAILAGEILTERESRLLELANLRERMEAAEFAADAHAEAARRFKVETYYPAMRDAQRKVCPAVFEQHWKPALRRMFEAKVAFDAAWQDARNLADELTGSGLFSDPLTDCLPFREFETRHWADELVNAKIVTESEVIAAGVRHPE